MNKTNWKADWIEELENLIIICESEKGAVGSRAREYSKGRASMAKEFLNAVKELDEPVPPRTNGDRIRQMSDEELARLIYPADSDFDKCNFCAEREDVDGGYGCYENCLQGILEYLKSEVER